MGKPIRISRRNDTIKLEELLKSMYMLRKDIAITLGRLSKEGILNIDDDMIKLTDNGRYMFVKYKLNLRYMLSAQILYAWLDINCRRILENKDTLPFSYNELYSPAFAHNPLWLDIMAKVMKNRRSLWDAIEDLVKEGYFKRIGYKSICLTIRQ